MRLGFTTAELKFEFYGYKVLKRDYDKEIPRIGPQENDPTHVNIQAMAGNRWKFKAPPNESFLNGAIMKEGDSICILKYSPKPNTNAIGVTGTLTVRTRDIGIQPVESKQSAINILESCVTGANQKARDGIFESLVAKALHKSGVGAGKTFRGILTIAEYDHFPEFGEGKC